jgi:hypothetical protein
MAGHLVGHPPRVIYPRRPESRFSMSESTIEEILYALPLGIHGVLAHLTPGDERVAVKALSELPLASRQALASVGATQGDDNTIKATTDVLWRLVITAKRIPLVS